MAMATWLYGYKAIWLHALAISCGRNFFVRVWRSVFGVQSLEFSLSCVVSLDLKSNWTPRSVSLGLLWLGTFGAVVQAHHSDHLWQTSQVPHMQERWCCRRRTQRHAWRPYQAQDCVWDRDKKVQWAINRYPIGYVRVHHSDSTFSGILWHLLI